MRHLIIFEDDGSKVATITWADGWVFICARSSREWKEMRRLVDSGYKVNVKHPKFLEHVAERAHSYNYNTELVEDKK